MKYPAFAQLLRQLNQRLIRMKALDDFRFQGELVTGIDGTGYLSFSHCHCPRCLTQKHASGEVGRTPTDYQEQKQDCQLKAFDRLAQCLKASFPQLRLCLNFEALYACGRAFAICQNNHWHFVVTFKEGSLPALWQEFQALLKLQPEQKLALKGPDKTRRLYRWVEHLPYTDSQDRPWTLGAILCEETSPTGEKTTFAWLTNLAVNRQSVIAIADQVGRLRVKIENEGFNVQKNSGLNLEHVFSQDWDHAKAYYYLLRIGHLLLQLLRHNSLHQALAKQYGQCRVLALWGALKKIPQRLPEALRYFLLAEAYFDVQTAARCHIRLNSS
ncbi:MAG: hypothetical protein ABSG59_19485 [Verrucomicrobiota bacterium]